jgi:hypothetical protein
MKVREHSVVSVVIGVFIVVWKICAIAVPFPAEGAFSVIQDVFVYA